MVSIMNTLLGMVTGGAKSLLLPYLSLIYLMNSMNRT
jgi:hypothetical protein